MGELMDGKALAQEIKGKIAERVRGAKTKPSVAAILIGGSDASKKYVELKGKDCAEVGMDFQAHDLPAETTKEELFELIDKLNADSSLHGMIVQLPIPDHLDKGEVVAHVDPAKDIDGLHPYNVGRLWLGMYDFDKSLLPCTPKGVIRILDKYGVDPKGAEVTIINRSDIVGKPLAKLLMDRHATVTVCHTRTKDLKAHARAADILITAVGRRPDYVVGADMVGDGATVIDVGISFVDGKLGGDVDMDAVKDKAAFIAPVPGGVGPMTRAMLLDNALIATGV